MIKIKDETSIELSREEYERLYYEYRTSTYNSFGFVPSFETWVRKKYYKE